MLSVAVVGAGPAGVYAAHALCAADDVRVDVLDRLPTPFGLVRYGVAPDHPKLKAVGLTLATMLQHPAVRFLGNVDVGRDLTVADLHEHYDAVVLANGAPVDRRLGIPGEDLAGSFSATDFVAWYCGHPDASVSQFTLTARSVAVVGAGNVALDVARILAKPVEDLVGTDIPQHALAVLRDSRVSDVHLVSRRGPAQAKFTIKELRELGEVNDCDVVVDPAELELDPASRAVADSDRSVQRTLDVLTEWAARPLEGRRRRLHLHFWARPVEIVGDGRVDGVLLEATRLDAEAGVTGTGQVRRLEVQMVLRSIGYRGVPTPGMPFDDRAGVIPHLEGRVLRDQQVAPGEYVAGWVKRGPTGVIGTNKRDASATVAALLADAASGALPRAPVRDAEAILEVLAARGVEVVTWEGWSAIEAAEAALGHAQGRARSKIHDRAALLDAARRAGDPTHDPADAPARDTAPPHGPAGPSPT